MSRPRVRLRPGLRVSVRGNATLQVGLHPGHRVVLPDLPHVRALLTLLGHGVDAERLADDQREPLRRLGRGGLLLDADDDVVRSRARERGRVEVVASQAVQPTVTRLLAEAGLIVSREGRPSVALIVTTGSETRRADIDRLVQTDRAHLLVSAVAGRLRVGPCVVPGLTACLRCVDEHLTDRDPRHPLVVEQHLDVDPADQPRPVDLQLGLVWAVRDVVALLEGDRPTTWSATVDLEPDGPVTQRWRRHPRCGCAWGDALAG